MLHLPFQLSIESQIICQLLHSFFFVKLTSSFFCFCQNFFILFFSKVVISLIERKGKAQIGLAHNTTNTTRPKIHLVKALLEKKELLQLRSATLFSFSILCQGFSSRVLTLTETKGFCLRRVHCFTVGAPSSSREAAGIFLGSHLSLDTLLNLGNLTQ